MEKSFLPIKAGVPFGDYCYDLVHIDGRDILEFEQELQRLHNDGFGAWFPIFMAQTKRVFCPYWKTTDYGTVRCAYLGREAVGIGDGDCYRRAVEHFGSEEAANEACQGWLLGDAVKECRLNVKDPTG